MKLSHDERRDRAIAVLRDALFECISSMCRECGGPDDNSAMSLFDSMTNAIEVLSKTDELDSTDRSGDVWRGEATMRKAAL